MKVAILDDDPTGTQTAAGVTVLLDWTVPDILRVLSDEDVVFLQTNSRALDRDAAVGQAQRIRDELERAGEALGEPVQVVLRGDSTLRGHVFAESAVFAAQAPVLFVPAFPAAGRRTVDGVHLVRVNDRELPAAETEFADDPVFGYIHSDLEDFARAGGAPAARRVDAGDPDALTSALGEASPGEFVMPDVRSDADLHAIAGAVRRFWNHGGQVVVRSAAPLAAMLGDCYSMTAPVLPEPANRQVLVVCGSHTAAATAQLARLAESAGSEPHSLDTEAALRSPEEAGVRLGAAARGDLERRGVAIIATDRVRRSSESSLGDAALVMRALIAAARVLAPAVGTVVTKGGITAAEVTGGAFRARSARVLGPIATGVPVWRLDEEAGGVIAVIVPGNVGDEGLLRDVVTEVTRGRHERIVR